MSNRFLNVKFGADTSGFSKGTNQVKSELTELNSAMRINKREQKELNDEIKKLEKQQKDLKTVMSQVKNPTKEMTDEANRLQQALDKAALKSAQLKTEEQELKGKISSTTKELKEQSAAADKNAISVEKVGNALKKALTFTATGAGALFTATAKFAASADEINTLAKQTGLATDEIQKFMYASELIDVSLDTLTGSMARLIRNMNTAATTGSGTAYDAFVALNVAVTDASGTLRNNQDVFDEVIGKLARIEDETQRDAYAMAIFGKSAQELNPLILGGTEQLKAFGDELEREGLILDQMQLDKLNEFNDKIDTFKAKFQAKMMDSSVDWVDAFDELLDKSDEIVELVATLITGFAKVTGFVVEHKEAVLALVVAYGTYKTVMTIGNLIQSVVSATKTLTTATKSATVAQKGMNAACAANPYVVLASVLLSLITSFSVFALTASQAEEKVSDFVGTTEELKKSLEESEANAYAEADMLKTKGERYEELRKKVNRTAAEEQELYNIAVALEAAYPNQIRLIGEAAGEYNELGNQAELAAEKIVAAAEASAKASVLQDSYAEKYKMQSRLDSILGEISASDAVDEYRFDENGYLAIKTDEFWSSEAKDMWALVKEYNQIVEEMGSIDSLITDMRGFLGGDFDSDSSGTTTELENLASSLSDLEDEYELVSKAEKELSETHELSTDTLNALVAKYPELQGIVNDYIAGVASGEDVINRLRLAYEMDVKNNASAFQQKMNTDTEYYKKLQQMNDTYINELASEYGVDLTNYQNYAEAKLAIEKAFLTSKAKNWAKYYDAEGQRYKMTDKDIIQYKKELQRAGWSKEDIDREIAKYGVSMQEFYATRNAVNAWNSLEGKLDGDLVDYSKYYIAQTVDSENTTSGSSGSSKKEISVYEQAKASYAKLVNDRLEEIKKLTDAETAGADERIAAINAEIEARKKLSESDDLQKRIGFIKGQLKYSQLDDFERHELTKQLTALEKDQADTAWEEGKRAEIAAIEAEKAAAQKANEELTAKLQSGLSYANTLFTDLQNGFKAATTIANDNSKVANINIVEKALTQGQVTQIVKDALGIEEVFL